MASLKDTVRLSEAHPGHRGAEMRPPRLDVKMDGTRERKRRERDRESERVQS